MFTHHSHSGDFCQHAEGALEDMILTAIRLKFKVICLTEHIPRLDPTQLYPEEVSSGTTVKDLQTTFDAYIECARKLRDKYKSQIDILVGFESESISGEHLDYILHTLIPKFPFQIYLGSVHHLLGIPIDYGVEMWMDIYRKLDSDVIKVLGLYFDMQYENMILLNPKIIAHFDLIRLCAPPGFIPEDLKSIPEIWNKIVRNIAYIKKIDAMVEINTAAIRKGWNTPYPAPDIASYLIESGIEFCMSDDSHKLDQVGLNYRPSLEYIESLGLKKMSYLTSTGRKSVLIEDMKKMEFWNLTQTTVVEKVS